MIPLHGSYTQTAHQKTVIAGSLRTGLAQLGWSFPELLTSFLHSSLQLFCLRPRRRPHPCSQQMIWFTAVAGDVGQCSQTRTLECKHHSEGFLYQCPGPCPQGLRVSRSGWASDFAFLTDSQVVPILPPVGGPHAGNHRFRPSWVTGCLLLGRPPRFSSLLSHWIRTQRRAGLFSGPSLTPPVLFCF